MTECFLGGAWARYRASEGVDAAFARAIAQILSRSDRTCDKLYATRCIKWTGTTSIGGAYSDALPAHYEARLQLARPFENLTFLAGEATEPDSFSTAHGALQSGLRAADQVLKVFARVS